MFSNSFSLLVWKKCRFWQYTPSRARNKEKQASSLANLAESGDDITIECAIRSSDMLCFGVQIASLQLPLLPNSPCGACACQCLVVVRWWRPAVLLSSCCFLPGMLIGEPSAGPHARLRNLSSSGNLQLHKVSLGCLDREPITSYV